MDNIDIDKMKQNKDAYLRYATLTKELDNIEYEKDAEMTLSQFRIICSDNKKLPLPSGRWGNTLAAALENHQFVSATHIYENRDILGINIDCVSTEYDGSNPLNFAEELEIALSYFDMKEELEEIEKIKEVRPIRSDMYLRRLFHGTLPAIEELKKYASNYLEQKEANKSKRKRYK